MIGRLHHVVLDCPDPERLALFYSQVLGWPITHRSAHWVVVSAGDQASGLAFQLAPDHAPPSWPEPGEPQQMHLDIMVDDPLRAGPRVVALGVVRLADLPGTGGVYADPAGHPFCLVPRPEWAPPIGP